MWNPQKQQPQRLRTLQSFNKVVEASEKAKLSMKIQVDRHRNPAPDYQVGQQVWLFTDNLCMLNRASKKLTEKWIGPYEVTRVTPPNAVELKLPKTLRIHLVVNVSRVKLLRFHRFHMPVAAECPACLVFPSHSVAAVRPSVLTMFPLYL